MFMAIAMFLAQNEENKQERAKEFYDVISKFEVMLEPTLSNARTNRHQWVHAILVQVLIILKVFLMDIKRWHFYLNMVEESVGIGTKLEV